MANSLNKAAKLTPKQKEVHEKLIASISKESRRFDMSRWLFTTEDVYIESEHQKTASCKTAACMAGHLEAIYPKQAKAIVASGAATSPSGAVWHELLAPMLYEKVTGEKCPLDFTAEVAEFGKDLEEITRAEAIAHIRGNSKKWPLLETSK